MVDKKCNIWANMEDSGMVSIIMLSKNKAQYVEESVRSVMAQTYQNWELLFVDDNSKDKTITLMMDLKDEAKIRKEDYTFIDRINVSQTVSDRGESVNRNKALKEASWSIYILCRSAEVVWSGCIKSSRGCQGNIEERQEGRVDDTALLLQSRKGIY